MVIFASRYYEKSRNEKSRNMENHFKFGTIVEEDYFTDKSIIVERYRKTGMLRMKHPRFVIGGFYDLTRLWELPQRELRRREPQPQERSRQEPRPSWRGYDGSSWQPSW